MILNLLFASSYADLGGGETALLALVGALDHTRFTPHLLVPREGQLAERWRANGWPVHVLPYRGATTFFIPALWARLPVSRRIEQLIRDHNIHAAHSDYHALPMLLPAAERAGIPALWTCMGWWFHPKPWQRGFFQRPAGTFAHSKAIKRGFLGEPPFIPSGRVEVLYPGVDTARFHPDVDGSTVRAEAGVSPDAPLVVMAARFQDVKGHDTFQAMARWVAKEIPQARFIVAGENTQTSADNTYKRRILDSVQADPLLRHRLIYLGFRDDVERVLAAADVIVCASRFEGYGVVNIEAMAGGRPVVSTNRGGPAETIVDGETGYLVPPEDPVTMARRVIELLRDPELRAKMGAAGRARVERLFSAKANGEQFTRKLDEILRI